MSLSGLSINGKVDTTLQKLDSWEWTYLTAGTNEGKNKQLIHVE